LEEITPRPVDGRNHAQIELDGLTDLYQGAAAKRAEIYLIEVVHGPPAVAQRFAQLQQGAVHEVLALVKSTVAVVCAEENVDEEIAVQRGITYRVVLERASFDDPGFFATAIESVEAGEHLRVVDSVPLRLVIADRQLALPPLLPTRQDAGGGALLVHRSGLLDALLSLFDFVWRQATPFVATADGVSEGTIHSSEIDEVDAQVLGLLLAGLTDEAVGRQLGLSLRTVQRRVHRLMTVAGAGTRFQLGHAATARGWLPKR